MTETVRLLLSHFRPNEETFNLGDNSSVWLQISLMDGCPHQFEELTFFRVKCSLGRDALTFSAETFRSYAPDLLYELRFEENLLVFGPVDKIPYRE